MRLLLASAALLAGCAPTPRPVAPAPLTAIAFHVSSWGRPVSSWTIAPDGSGSYTHAEGPGFGTRLVTRKVDAGAQGFARIRALLAPAERAAAAPPGCGQRWTDFPYGAAVWTGAAGKAEIPFDLGCKNPALKPIHEALQAAGNQMQTWSKAGQVIEDKEITP